MVVEAGSWRVREAPIINSTAPGTAVASGANPTGDANRASRVSMSGGYCYVGPGAAFFKRLAFTHLNWARLASAQPGRRFCEREAPKVLEGLRCGDAPQRGVRGATLPWYILLGEEGRPSEVIPLT